MTQPAAPLLRPCTLIWLLLMALTCATYALGQMGLEGRGLILAVLGIALLKGHLIIDWYMGLRWVSGFWRPLLGLYLVTIGLLIAVAFLLPAHSSGRPHHVDDTIDATR